MHFNLQKTGILLIGILLTGLIMPFSHATNYDLTYDCTVQFGLDDRKLYVSVPSSLYDYYQGKTHAITDEAQYSNFVTPEAVAPIAQSIRALTSEEAYGDEEFANAVLVLVQQIPYVESDAKYPIETIVDNKGDCDTVSLLAASILKAGELDVVLFYYKEAAHMNIGIHLSDTPSSLWWTPPTSYEYKGKEYWVAECTPKVQWRVGDQPNSLAGEKPLIIPVDDCEKSPPAKIASELDKPLNSSSISINLSSPLSALYNGESNLTVSGFISPASNGANVAMYLSQDRTSWSVCNTETDKNGKYSFDWSFTSTGTYYLQTSWSGTAGYAGADSETLTVFIGFPKSTVQFEAPNYIYIMGNPGAATYELRIRQGIEDFLDFNLEGTGVIITGDFIVLKSGETISIKDKPEIPLGEQPLRMPLNLVKNDQFCFILQNYGQGNYKVQVKAMDDYSVSQIQEFHEDRTVLLNASESISENTWYKIKARLSETEITAQLFDADGALLESMAIRNGAVSIGEIGILVANNTNKAIAFKNLKIETVNQSLQPLDENVNPTNNTEAFASYINWAIVVVSASIAVFYVWKREKTQRLKPNHDIQAVPIVS